MWNSWVYILKIPAGCKSKWLAGDIDSLFAFASCGFFIHSCREFAAGLFRLAAGIMSRKHIWLLSTTTESRPDRKYGCILLGEGPEWQLGALVIWVVPSIGFLKIQIQFCRLQPKVHASCYIIQHRPYWRLWCNYFFCNTLIVFWEKCLVISCTNHNICLS